MAQETNTDKEKKEREAVARIEFTPEQRKAISKMAGRDIAAMHVVELTREEVNKLSPGILRATAVVMCW